MIERDIVVTVTDEDLKLNSKVILYRGDGTVIFNFNIMDNRYRYTTQSILKGIEGALANATIVTPKGAQSFKTAKLPCEGDIVKIAITKDIIDEVTEVGKLQMQIHLYSKDNNRITLAPFEFEIRDTIADIPDYEQAGIVGIGRVGEAVVLGINQPIEIRYEKNQWSLGDLITADKLNKIEDGIQKNSIAIEGKSDKGHTHSWDEITGKPSIPTKTSELTNDSDFATVSQIPTKTSQLQNDSDFAKNSSLPTKVSQLENDTDFITSSGIPAIPSKTSELVNDSNYVTTETLNTSLEGKANKEHTHSQYVTQNDIDRAIDKYHKNVDISMVDGSVSEYSGSFITLNPSEEGSTGDLIIKGRTLQNLIGVERIQNGSYSNGVITLVGDGSWNNKIYFNTSILKADTVYTIIVSCTKNTFTEGANGISVHVMGECFTLTTATTYAPNEVGTKVVKVTTKPSIANQNFFIEPRNVTGEWQGTVMLLEGDWTNKEIPPYFEGIESTGEEENGLITIGSHGKNLVDFKDEVVCGAGVASETPRHECDLKKGDVYFTVFYNDRVIKSNNIAIRFYYADGTNGWYSIGKENTRYTLAQDCKEYTIFWNENLSNDITINGLLVTQFSHEDLKYVPYKNLERQFVLENSTTELYHPTLVMGSINSSTGEDVGLDNRVKTQYIPFGTTSNFSVEGLTDTQKVAVLFYDKNKKVIQWSDWLNGYKNNPVPDTCAYIRVLFAKRDDGTISNVNEFDNVKVTKFVSDALRGIPNGVSDRIFLGTDGEVKCEKNIEKVIFNGSENWSSKLLSTDGTYASFQLSYSKLARGECMSDRFVYQEIRSDAGAQAINGEYLGVYRGTSMASEWFYLSIQLSKLETPDVEGLKKWLKANPVTVYYQTKTPEVIRLYEYEIDLPLYDDISYVYSKNTLGASISFKTDFTAITLDPKQYFKATTTKSFLLPNVDNLPVNSSIKLTLYVDVTKETSLIFPSEVLFSNTPYAQGKATLEIILTCLKTNDGVKWLGSSKEYVVQVQ